MKKKTLNTNPRTVAELLLEPNARGFATPPEFIKGVLQGHKNMETHQRIVWEISRMRGRRRELAARGADGKTLSRYDAETAILKMTAEMLWEMVRGGNAR